jgi:Rieske Fe-S protein
VTNEPTTADVETVAELPTRRAALAVAAGGCVLAVAGCSSYGEDAAAAAAGSQANQPAGEGGDPAASGEDGEEQKSTDSIAAVADIPVGGGMILKKQGVVLTQPTKGKIKAFSVTCTHAGCAVTKVNDGTIDCACHGSKFAIADGKPTDGPAKTPLEKVSVKVKSKKVYLA